MNLEQRLRRLESELPTKRPAESDWTPEQLADPEVQRLFAELERIRVADGGDFPEVFDHNPAARKVARELALRLTALEGVS